MTIYTMFKRLAAAAFILAVMCTTSWGATQTVPETISVDQDYRYSLRPERLDTSYANYLYTLYGDDTGFNYQLRELAGTTTAGPQWFATVYENYYYTLFNTGDTTGLRRVYRRTMGGEIPEIPVSAVGNIIGGFNFMLLEEPQPYPGWVNVYDTYPDPMESLCLVIKNGSGNFTVKFGNPYAGHYPYWWHWTTTPSSRLWDERGRVASINEPIAFMVNTSERIISERGTDGSYTDKYTFSIVIESDDGGGITGRHYEVFDNSGSLACKTSGDSVLDSDENIVYSISGDNIYDVSGSLAYTLENGGNNVIYVCEVRKVTESVRIDGMDDYSFVFIPGTEQLVNPGDYYTADVRINSVYGSEYGSRLGYITFNQRADLLRGYTRYRENTTIPLVIANVYDGNAAEEPLQFDMTVYDSHNDVVNRVKFTWDAQRDMPNQDFGTFFMISDPNSETEAESPYYLDTQITNRTGTRYRLYRYDMLGRTAGFQEILPRHWKYDLPMSQEELSRDSLPPYFHLDAHSQIAPGLVTVYDHEVYGTVDMRYDTYESFQLSEYDSPNPKNLRLNYKRVGGMSLLENGEVNLEGEGVRTREFGIDFADVVNNDEETEYELENLIGKKPVWPHRTVAASFKSSASSKKSKNSVQNAQTVYVNSSAVAAFRFAKPVDLMITPSTISEDELSEDSTAPAVSGDFSGGAFRLSEAVTVSNEIAIQPLQIRMKIHRRNAMITDHWADFEKASTSTALFNLFSNYCSVWLRTDTAGEKITNLFTAINNKGNALGVSASDCVRAFIYGDELYLDFIVFIADGQSINAGKTAYVEIFKDDGVPYILIGDGSENGEWDMTFYIDAAGENPTPRTDTSSSTNSSNGSGSSSGTDTVNTASGSDDSGGGGCNTGFSLILGALLLLGATKSSRA